ncbi:MAG: helicase HerA domain-containing protein [Candidatus Thorarchaeota archaeon]
MGIVGSLLKLATCAGGALVSAAIAKAVLVALNPFMNEGLSSLGFLITLVCIGGGLYAGAFQDNWNILKDYSGPAVVFGTFAIFLVGLPMSLIEALFPSIPTFVALIVSTGIIVVGVLAIRQRNQSQLSPIQSRGIAQSIRNLVQNEASFAEDHLGGVEVVEIPQDHLLPHAQYTDRWVLAEPFYNLLKAVTHSGISFGVRIQRVNRRMRVFFLTRASDRRTLSKNVQSLAAKVQTSLGAFRIIVHDEFPEPTGISSMKARGLILQGEPLSIEHEQQSVNGLTAIAEALQGIENGIAQIWIDPTRGGMLQEWWTRRGLESELKKSKKSRVRGDDTYTEVDTIASLTARRHASELRRQEALVACNVRVNLIAWASRAEKAERAVSQLGHTLVSSIRPADEKRDLRVAPMKTKQDILKVANGLPEGQATLMHLSEAVSLIVLPRGTMGIKISKRQSFPTAYPEIPVNHLRFDEKGELEYTKRRPIEIHEDRWWRHDSCGVVLLGFPLTISGKPDHGNPIWLKPSDMRGHFAVFGTTGTGKTWTSVCIAAQLIYIGVKPIIIVPHKVRDWRLLRSLFPDIRIFTAGNPDTAPLLLNFWEPPEGVSLMKWIERLSDVFHAWLPNEDVITMHFRLILQRAYQICMWDVNSNKRGRPILLSDLYDAIEYYIENDLKYGNEVSRNFAGALRTRMKAILMDPEFVRMFNTKGGLTFKELLEHPTIIEIEGLGDLHAELLMGIMTGGISEYRMANPVNAIENVLVLEEAHTLLKKVARRTDGRQSATEQAMDSIIRMLRVIAGNGLGLLLIDQLPGLLVEEALTIPKNVIIHKVRHEEVELATSLTRCDEHQKVHIGGLETGEAIVLLDRQDSPMNVQVFTLREILVASPYEQRWPNIKVAEIMKDLFEREPERFISEILPEHILKTLELRKSKLSFTLDNETVYALERLVRNPEFERVFHIAVEKAKAGKLQYLVQLAVETAKIAMAGDDALLPLAVKVIQLAAEEYSNSVDEPLLSDVHTELEKATA